MLAPAGRERSPVGQCSGMTPEGPNAEHDGVGGVAAVGARADRQLDRVGGAVTGEPPGSPVTCNCLSGYGLVKTGVTTFWNTLCAMVAVTLPPTPSQMPYWLLRIRLCSIVTVSGTAP